MERRWRAKNTEANHLAYTDQCRVVNDLIRSAEENHFSSIIESNRGDQRILFQAVNNLLYRKPTVRYPSITPDTALAEKFKSFFVHKIRLIRDSLPVPSAGILNDLSLDNYGAQLSREGGVLPYMGYIGMCGPKGYVFAAVLFINRVSIIAILPPLW